MQASDSRKIQVLSNSYKKRKNEIFIFRKRKIKTDSQSRLDRPYRHAKNIRNQDKFEDEFTIVEVAFS